MNCEYIHQYNIHEKYLLDRLIKPEIEDYLNHIKECKKCSDDLEKQRLTIVSIREIGKREMKGEITGQVLKLKKEKTLIDWDMIYKIAAVFFFIVITPGLVYYYFTFESPQLSPEMTNAEGLVSESEKINNVTLKEEIDSEDIVPAGYDKDKPGRQRPDRILR